VRPRAGERAGFGEPGDELQREVERPWLVKAAGTVGGDGAHRGSGGGGGRGGSEGGERRGGGEGHGCASQCAKGV
jgi:hypothetical protein